jgi:extradiol dioxygenase family protein
LVIHYKPKEESSELHTNAVDGKDVPVPHFGVVLDWDIFNAFAEDLKSKNIEFIIEPYVRFQGLVGEQATMFFYDPAGNALEFKAFKDMNQLFAK